MIPQEDDPYRAPESHSDPTPADATAAGRKFRLLLVLHVVITLAGIGAGFLPNRFSPQLAAAYEHEPMGWIDQWTSPIPLLVFTFALVAMMLAGIVGMFLFKRWGRAFSLGFTVLSFALYPVSGPSLLSGFEQMLWDSAALLWGAILAMAYYSPVKLLFGGASTR